MVAIGWFGSLVSYHIVYFWTGQIPELEKLNQMQPKSYTELESEPVKYQNRSKILVSEKIRFKYDLNHNSIFKFTNYF